jgi:23S rRNA (cytosine1962-C5)-methyltransferase
MTNSSSSLTRSLIHKAVQKRKPLYSITNALRLVNGQGDGLKGLVIEQYDKHFVIQIFDLQAQQFLTTAVEYLKDQFDVEYLILKNRILKGEEYHSEVVLALKNSQTIIKENNLNFTVDLNDTINTGLFLDMRHNRKMIGELSPGKEVLNCFAYTCSFGVYARAYEAKRVENVDVSQKILNKGKENYQLNHLDFLDTDFRRANVIDYLKRAKKLNNQFDLIILDPPSFARSEGKVFSVKKDLGGLIGSSISILKPKGVFFVSTNSSELSFDFLRKVATTQAQAIGRKIQTITECGQDVDFLGSGTMKESCLSALLVKLN